MAGLSRIQAEEAATIIAPMLQYCDLLLQTFDLTSLECGLNNLRGRASRIAALPFPTMQNKADVLTAEAKTFGALLQLLEARKAQQETVRKGKRFVEGPELLERLGL